MTELARRLAGVPEGARELLAAEDMLFRMWSRSAMRTARFTELLRLGGQILDRRVRLAYAVLGTSITLVLGYGIRAATAAEAFDLSRILIPLFGFALGYVALRIEKAHYKKEGEYYIKAVAMEEEDDSTAVDGPAWETAQQHMEGNGLSSVGGAVAMGWIGWLIIASYEISRM